MTATAIALVLASVVLHAAWNAVAKSRPTFAFFYYSNIVGAILLLPVVYLHADVVWKLPQTVWWFLTFAGMAQAVGGLALMRAYAAADLSVAYPLIRSLGPVFIVLGSLALGRQDAISIGCLLGIAAIVVGTATLGLSNMRALGQRTISGIGFFFCVSAALATMGYTLIDDAGVHEVLNSGALDQLREAPARSGLLYASIEGWFSFFWMSVWLFRKREYRAELRAYTSRAAIRDAVVVGIGSYASYALVLIAMLYASDVSYVAGFRQLSIPLGAAIGVLGYGEHIDGMKVFGLSAMLAGLLAIALT